MTATDQHKDILKPRKAAWYMVSTLPNKEEQVIEDLTNKVNETALEDFFQEFKIFYEPRISNKELAKRQRNEPYKITRVNLYKGYIFIKMVITDETWFLTRNTEGVTGLIGSHGSGVKPTPISDRKFKRYLAAEEKKFQEFEESLHHAPFNVGDFVMVTSGEFTSEAETDVYEIKEVNEKNQTVIIMIEYAGKLTSIELGFDQLQKVEH